MPSVDELVDELGWMTAGWTVSESVAWRVYELVGHWAEMLVGGTVGSMDGRMVAHLGCSTAERTEQQSVVYSVDQMVATMVSGSAASWDFPKDRNSVDE